MSMNEAAATLLRELLEHPDVAIFSSDICCGDFDAVDWAERVIEALTLDRSLINLQDAPK